MDANEEVQDRCSGRSTTTDSNVWGRVGPYLHLHASANGTTGIDVVVAREGKNLKGWVLGLVLGTIGKRVLEKALKTRSGPSKPGTAEQRRHAHREPGSRTSEFTLRQCVAA
jgi:hypothetical protein